MGTVHKVTFSRSAPASGVVSASPEPTARPVDPLVKWAGGKRRIAPLIVHEYIGSLLPPQREIHGDVLNGKLARFRRYREPFLGGGAVFLEMSAAYPHFDAVLGDMCRPLVASYRVVRDAGGAEAVSEELRQFEGYYNAGSSSQQARLYDEERELFNAGEADPASMKAVVQAARFIFLNRACFNGLYRTNSRGQFNVPFGKRTSIALPTLEHLRAFAAVLGPTPTSPGPDRDLYVIEGWTDLRVEGYEVSLSEAAEGDVVYLDPPYAKVGGAGFTGYQPGDFGWAEQERLALRSREAVRRGAVVVASNRATPECVALWRDCGFEVAVHGVRHCVGAEGDRRGVVEEMIAAGGPKW